MATDNGTTTPLPSWEESEARVHQGDATALHRFIYEQEPHGAAEETFRAMLQDVLAAASGGPKQRRGIYVASRASIPERAAMWRHLRAQGVPIISTWIDEAGEGETGDFVELWARIEREVTGAAALIFYVEPDDFPLKGVLVEVGMALAAGLPVYAVLAGVAIKDRSMRPVGSWLHHPEIRICSSLALAFNLIGDRCGAFETPPDLVLPEPPASA